MAVNNFGSAKYSPLKANGSNKANTSFKGQDIQFDYERGLKPFLTRIQLEEIESDLNIDNAGDKSLKIEEKALKTLTLAANLQYLAQNYRMHTLLDNPSFIFDFIETDKAKKIIIDPSKIAEETKRHRDNITKAVSACENLSGKNNEEKKDILLKASKASKEGAAYFMALTAYFCTEAGKTEKAEFYSKFSLKLASIGEDFTYSF